MIIGSCSSGRSLGGGGREGGVWLARGRGVIVGEEEG